MPILPLPQPGAAVVMFTVRTTYVKAGAAGSVADLGMVSLSLSFVNSLEHLPFCLE